MKKVQELPSVCATTKKLGAMSIVTRNALRKTSWFMRKKQKNSNFCAYSFCYSYKSLNLLVEKRLAETTSVFFCTPSKAIQIPPAYVCIVFRPVYFAVLLQIAANVLT